MILVDSSVWADYFRGTITPQTDCLDLLLSRELLCIGDLILTEVLQGFGSEREFNQARKLLLSLDVIGLGGQESALVAARNIRTLRARGLTVRKTMNALIATRCIETDLALLYSDRDFDPFVTHLGLRCALTENSKGVHVFQVQQQRAPYLVKID